MSCCSSTRKTEGRSDGGAVLLLALVCLLALSGIAVLASKRSSREALDARFLAAEYQADLLAESLLDQARLLLLEDRETLADIPQDVWAETLRGEGYELVIEPCNARLNLNMLPEDERSAEALREMLEKSETPPDNIDYLLDWIDDNGEERIPGSEGAVYRERDYMDGPRNAPLARPEELLLVHGFSGLEKDWIRERCTVDSQGPVNLNFVSEELFKALMPELRSRFPAVAAWRESKGFNNKGDFSKALPELEDDDDLLKAFLDTFSVSSACFLVSIEIQSPFVYEKRRYIVEREAFLMDRLPRVLSGEVLEILPRKPQEGS